MKTPERTLDNPPHLAVVVPRFSAQGTIGGAETLLKNLAEHAAAAGCRVTVLTTCARDHFTWKNELPAGSQRVGDLEVHYFPVDKRDSALFHRLQTEISRGNELSLEDQRRWLHHGVQSTPLMAHLREHGAAYDRVIAGPYLFGLVFSAARAHPAKTWLVPCLHDEPFARQQVMREIFAAVAGCLFNTEPERDLAQQLFALPDARCRVVGMGFDAFEARKEDALKAGLPSCYVLYSGRREPLKGTPLLCDYMAAFRSRTGRDIKLVLTGSGPVTAPPELTPHLVDLGFVDEGRKRAVMAAAVAFIHPSCLESLGIVLLEAWMAGTPALVPAHSPVLQWQCARSGAGLWFRNYPEFEEGLLRLLDDPGLREAMGSQGRAFVLREYAWQSVERRFFDALGLSPAGERG